MLVKICGLTCAEDVAGALNAGADLVGFVLAPSSRRIDWDQLAQLTPPGKGVAVLVNPTADEVERAFACGVAYVQLHGQESPEFCRPWQERIIKALSAADLEHARRYAGCHLLLLDSPRPGSGQTWDYRQLQGFELPYLLAGGLAPETLEEALAGLTPYGLDASSSLECGPGRKDHQRMQQFVDTARRWA